MSYACIGAGLGHWFCWVRRLGLHGGMGIYEYWLKGPGA